VQSTNETVFGTPPVPLIQGTGVGTCFATLTLANGATYSKDITFASAWYACGSDPHGCGEDFESDAGSYWFIDNPCDEGGSPDVASDAQE
jgi:hypothetical protein